MAGEWKQIIAPTSFYDPHGLRERKLSTGFCHLRVGFSANPEKDDNWARKHSLIYGGFDSPKWRREHLIDYRAFAGQRIWPLLCKDHDVYKDISSWTVFRVIDQGIRHPTVCIWVAVNNQGDRHVFREYYSNNRSIAMNCSAILSMSDEVVEMNLIDPSTKKRNDETLKSTIQVYEENDLYCVPADNSFAGYDAVSNGVLSTIARKALQTGVLPECLAVLKPDQKQIMKLAEMPALTFDTRFTSRCFEECCNLRWQETKGDMSQKAEKEKPVDKEDDGPDCVRYAMQSPLYFKYRSDGVEIIEDKKVLQLRKARKKLADIYNKRECRSYI